MKHLSYAIRILLLIIVLQLLVLATMILADVRLVVIPVSFSDATLNISDAQIRSTTEWEMALWRDIGYGQLAISAVYAPHVTLTKPRPVVCDWDSWIGEALQKASALGFSGDHPVFFSPSIPCAGTNNANRGFPFRLWMHDTDARSMAHEQGHTFGLKHAARLTGCPQGVLDFRRCTQAEYGNPYSVMGIGRSYLSIYEAVFLGLQPPIATVDAGTYTIAGIASAGPGRGIIVKRGQGQFWIERRIPVGLDAGIGEERILINYIGGDVWNSALVGLTLVADLKAGETFTDTLGGVSIRSNGSSGSVTVARFSPPIPTQTPTPRPGTTPIRTLTPQPTQSGGTPCGTHPFLPPCPTATPLLPTRVETPTATSSPTSTPTATAAPPATPPGPTPPVLTPTNAGSQNTPTPTPTSTASVPTNPPVSPTKKPTGGGRNDIGWYAGGLAALIAALSLIFRKKKP